MERNDMFQYMCDNNPNVIVSTMNSFGYPISDSHSLSDNFRDFFKKCSSHQKEKVLLIVKENHPDKELFIEESVMPACGCGANGVEVVKQSTQGPITSTVEKELSEIKAKEAAKDVLNQKILMLGVASIAIFLLIKNYK